jgi:ABC-type lipoprotein release transport system permease subunit
MKLIIIAWRNLWRNWKRTAITIAAVVLAVIISTLMSSQQEGTYVKMIDNVVKLYSGYIQIFHPGYWESRSIDDVYIADNKLNNLISESPDVSFFTSRMESFTLLSSGEHTRGSALIGIEPEKEDKITKLSRWISEGEYLNTGDNGILLAANLAKNLKVKIGDTITLISQGYHGESAAMLLPLKGILTFPAPQLNSFAAYVTLQNAQQYYSTGNMVTSTVLILSEYKKVDEVKTFLENKLGKDYNILTWADMQPELVQMIDGDRAGAVVMKGILYIIIGFGILGTIIMMMSERRKELGISIAIGMQRYLLQGVLFFETLFIGITGILCGFALSIPLIISLEKNPIPLSGKLAEAYEKFGMEPVIYFASMPSVFITQVIVVFIICLVVALYPVTKISRLSLIKALRGQ